MNEKLIERKLHDEVKKLGGLAVKVTSPAFTGLPDRMVLMPGGRIWYVELKSTGEKQSARQKFVTYQLRNLGFDVSVIDDEPELDEFLNHIQK